MVQAFVTRWLPLLSTQQLQNACLPFSDSKERKTLHVALHRRVSYHLLYESILTWLPSGQKLTCASVKLTRMWRSMVKEFVLVSVS